MVEWLKVFGLGFFNDKLAAKSAKYGFASIVLTIVLSFVFFMFGFMAADVVPFSTHYNNAAGFHEFIDNALSDTQLKIDNGLAKSEKIVNTYTNDGDKEKYAHNGYNLIIDTRASDMLIEFSQVAIKGDAEIKYEEYAALSEKEKESYKLEVRYTDRELQLTSERAAEFESYLDKIGTEGNEGYNAEAATAYRELKEKGLQQEEYWKEVYYLYVKYYYSDIEFVLMSAKAPVLCDYYYVNYILGDHDHYLYFFDDICAGSFESDRGVPAVFVGYYKDCVQKTVDVNTVDEFVKDLFYGSVGYSMSSYFTSAMQMAPAYILIPVLAGFVLWLICKAKKNEFGRKFSDCYKTVNTFAWYSALFTGLLTFFLAFFVFSRKLYLFMPLIYALILILRTAVFYFTRSAKEKTERNERQEAEADIC